MDAEYKKASEAMQKMDSGLGVWLRARGYKRVRGSRFAYAALSRGDPALSTIISWIASRDGIDPYAGGKFRLEVGAANERDWRVTRPGLLSQLEPDDARRFALINSAVVSRLPQPPRDYVQMIASEVREWYLLRFVANATGWQDEWSRFRTSRDIDEWSAFFMEVLPGVIARLERPITFH